MPVIPCIKCKHHQVDHPQLLKRLHGLTKYKAIKSHCKKGILQNNTHSLFFLENTNLLTVGKHVRACPYREEKEK